MSKNVEFVNTKFLNTKMTVKNVNLIDYNLVFAGKYYNIYNVCLYIIL